MCSINAGAFSPPTLNGNCVGRLGWQCSYKSLVCKGVDIDGMNPASNKVCFSFVGIYNPVLFELIKLGYILKFWAHLEIFGCSSAFTEFSDQGGQEKNLILQVTAETEGL